MAEPTGPTDGRSPRGAELAAALLLGVPYLTEVYCTDFWWHAATGRWIAENGTVPQVDTFSYTRAGAPLLDVNWLADLLLFLVYDGAGPAGLAALRFVVAATVAWFSCRSLAELGAKPATRVAGACLVGGFGLMRWTLDRPGTLGAAFAAGAVYLCARSFGRQSRAHLGLLPLGIVWAAVHPEALLVLPLYGVLAVASLARRDPLGRLLELGGLLLLGALLLVTTPRGQELLTHARAVPDDSILVRMTAEWMVLEPADPQSWAPLVVVSLAGLGGLLALPERRFGEATLRLGLAALGGLVGLRFVRMVPLGVLVAAPATLLAVEELTRRISRAVAAPGRAFSLAEGLLPLGVVLGLLAVQSWASEGLTGGGRFGVGIDAARAPLDTTARLLALPRGRVLNSLELGGYLIWRRVPGGVFVDGRTVQLYDEQFVSELLSAASAGGEQLEALAERLDIRYALASHGGPLDGALAEAPSWLPVLHGRASSLYVRARYAREVLAAGSAIYPLTRAVRDPAELEKYARALLSSPALTAAIRAELSLARSRGEFGAATLLLERALGSAQRATAH